MKEKHSNRAFSDRDSPQGASAVGLLLLAEEKLWGTRNNLPDWVLRKAPVVLLHFQELKVGAAQIMLCVTT